MNNLTQKIKELSKPIEEADFLTAILGNYYTAVRSGRISVVLFGAGSAGKHLCKSLRIHNISIACFCDNNPKVIGGYVEGRQVISVDDLKKYHSESLIIISVSQQNSQSIYNKLLQYGFSPDKIIILPLDQMLYYTNVSNLYWSPDELESCGQLLRKSYDIFEDDKSKGLFINRLALLTGGFDYNSFQHFINSYADLVSRRNSDYFTSPVYDENYFYFNSTFFPLRNNESFANVGALIGDCALEFVKACEEKGLQYKKIINFEPDPNNYKFLTSNMNSIPNVTSYMYGLWSEKTRLSFYNLDQPHTGVPGSIDSEGNMEVEVISLDELLSDSEISFIKMDIEGAELEALKGAANTIKRYKPKLAISVYHKRNDVFEIPLFIHQLYPGYKLYLRHHSSTFCETVLYAMP